MRYVEHHFGICSTLALHKTPAGKFSLKVTKENLTLIILYSATNKTNATILTKLESKKALTSVDSHILRKFSEIVQIFFSSPIVTMPAMCKITS